GYTMDEIEGENADTLVTTGPEMLREARNVNSAVWNRREMLTLNTVRTKKDGTPIPVKIYQFPFHVDEKTHLDYNVFIDMSDQARLETSIRKEKLFFEKLFESSPYSVTLEDANGTILKANRAFYSMFGYSVSDNIIGRDVNEIVALDPEIQKEARGMDSRFWNGENINQDVVRQRKDGSLIHLSLVQTLLELPDGARLVYVIYGDMTSRVRASEKLKRRLQFQKLTASLSSLFLEKGELASKLARGLAEINDFLETDAAWVVRFAETGQQVQRLMAKSPDDAPRPPRFPWLGEQIKKRRLLNIKSPDDFPEDSAERRFFGEAGFSGLLATGIGLEHTRGFILSGRRHQHATPNEEDLEILGIFANILDQTFGRAEAEEQLFRHRQMLEGILETQNDFIVRWKPDFTITFANQPYCRFRNADPETICGTSLLDLIPKEDIPHEHTILQRMLSGENLLACEEKATNAEGDVRWMHWYDKAIYDGQGRLVEIQSEGRDITELKEIQQELERSEKRYQSIVQDQDDMVIRITPEDGSLTFVNEAYCKRFGKSREKLLGSSIFAHVDCGEAGRLCREHFEKLTPDNPTNIDNSYSVFPRGEINYEQWSNRGIFDAAGNLVEIQCVGRDITDIKKASDELEHLNDILRSVRGVNRLINRERNPDRLIPGICGHLLDTRGYANVWIALMDGTGKLFTLTETGRDGRGNPLSEKLCNQALNDWGWKVLLTPGVTLNRNLVPFSDAPLMDSYKGKGVMTTRLEHDGVILGLICVSLPEGFEADSEEQDLFFETAQDIAAAIRVLDEEKERESQKKGNRYQGNADGETAARLQGRTLGMGYNFGQDVF
ncbi:MAG: PAS domain S-box protein, partial [Synergistota bacterium]|nr:PAS domain S-box protein [Synergistota bacterium]